MSLSNPPCNYPGCETDHDPNPPKEATQSDKEQQDFNVEEYLQLRNATNATEAFNLFIKRNCPDLYAHFIDSDDNEAEFVRRAIAEETNTARIETLKWFKEKGSKSNHCDSFELQVQEADVDFEMAKLRTLKANKGGGES